MTKTKAAATGATTTQTAVAKKTAAAPKASPAPAAKPPKAAASRAPKAPPQPSQPQQPSPAAAQIQPPNAGYPPLSGKLARLVELLQREAGVSVYDMADATGWQVHSVRGAMAGALKHRGYVVTSEKPADMRIYRIAPPPAVTRARRKGR